MRLPRYRLDERLHEYLFIYRQAHSDVIPRPFMVNLDIIVFEESLPFAQVFERIEM